MDEVGTPEFDSDPSAMDVAEAQATKDRDLLAALKARPKAPKIKPNRAQRRNSERKLHSRTAGTKRTVEVSLLAFARWQAAGSPDKTIIPQSKRRKRSRKTGRQAK